MSAPALTYRNFEMENFLEFCQDPLYSLAKGASLLFPVLTPIRNLTPRIELGELPAGTGVPCSIVVNRVHEPVRMALPPRVWALCTQITLENLTRAREDRVDIGALTTANLLRALMIGEEDAILYGLSDTRWVHHRLSFGGKNDWGRFPHPDYLSPADTNFNGLFAQLVGKGSPATNVMVPRLQSVSDSIRLVAGTMEGRNGALPEICFLNPAQAVQIAHETLADAQPYGAEESEIRVTKLGFPNRDETIELRVHPTLPEGNLLLLSRTIPEKLQIEINDAGLQEGIPAPWSLGLFHDYLEREIETGLREIRVCGALRVHLPQLFGIIRMVIDV